jgi:16S rRNA (cytosine967-C5)-methyltransferase
MLKKNGWLLYITCSVFKKENEDVVEFTRSNSGLELIEMELLKGYEEKADTMFAALFKRNL